MSVIINTTIISNFASLDALNLLHQSWPDLHISEQVFTEIQTGQEQGYTFYAGIEQVLFPLAEDGWLKLTSMQTEAERDRLLMITRVNGSLIPKPLVLKNLF